MRRLLPEWSPQSGVLLVWPDSETDWAPWLSAVLAGYSRLIAAIAEHEAVLVLVRNADTRQSLFEHVSARQRRRVRWAEIPYDDTWIRDYGPLATETDGRVVLCDFAFDGWGGKFPAWRDDRVSGLLHAGKILTGCTLQRYAPVLEGGALESDGAGTALCNLRTFAARFPAATQAQFEQWLAQTLGLTRFLWVDSPGLVGCDTDGHIDTLARFAGPDEIVFQACDDATDEHYSALQQLQRQLSALVTRDGQPFVLHALPWPQAVFQNGQRLPASYANFLITNETVLAPQFDDPADARACQVLARAFPKRRIVGIDSRVFLEQFGGIHCLTLQLPRGVDIAGHPF